eukprot:5810645-Prymnesium_polylepis.1
MQGVPGVLLELQALVRQLANHSLSIERDPRRCRSPGERPRGEGQEAACIDVLAALEFDALCIAVGDR